MGHLAKGELKKRNWLKQSQDKLACILLWLDVKSVEGGKEGKDEEINGEAIRPFGREKKKKKRSEVPECED